MVRAAEPQELDIHALLRLFVSKVQNGAPVTYATFRETWQEMKFSFIYEVSAKDDKPFSHHLSCICGPFKTFHINDQGYL